MGLTRHARRAPAASDGRAGGRPGGPGRQGRHPGRPGAPGPGSRRRPRPPRDRVERAARAATPSGRPGSRSVCAAGGLEAAHGQHRGGCRRRRARRPVAARRSPAAIDPAGRSPPASPTGTGPLTGTTSGSTSTGPVSNPTQSTLSVVAVPQVLSVELRDLLDPATMADIGQLERGRAPSSLASLQRAVTALRARASSIDAQARAMRQAAAKPLKRDRPRLRVHWRRMTGRIALALACLLTAATARAQDDEASDTERLTAAERGGRRIRQQRPPDRDHRGRGQPTGGELVRRTVRAVGGPVRRRSPTGRP